MPAFGDQAPQFPFNVGGNRGQMAFAGMHVLNVIGSGLISYRAQVTTGVPTGFQSGGVPGVTATLLSAGNYDVRFPQSPAVDIHPAVYGPSGALFRAQVVRGRQGLEPTASGTAIVQVFNPSGVVGNLPTGSSLALSFHVAPVTAF